MVIVNEQVFANAGNDVNIFEGESVQLTASGGDEYLWSTGESSESIIVNPSETTEYFVEVIKKGCSDTDNVVVQVDKLALIINQGSDMTICKGDEVELRARGGEAFLWNTGDVTEFINVSPIKTTTYFVSALVNGVVETSEITVNVEDCSNLKISEFKVYPNPTTGILNIYIPSVSEKITVRLISLNGVTVLNKTIKADSRGINTQLDLSFINKGIYIVKMFNDYFTETKKIMVI